MMLNRVVVVVLWVVSLLTVAALAQQSSPFPPSDRPPVIVIPAPDVAFRVDHWEGQTPVGRWVVRHPLTGNQWVEPRVVPGVKTLTAR
jgi:hypothetical protein